MTPRPLFRVAPEVFDHFPDYVVGCVAAYGILAGEGAERVTELLETAEHRARTTFDGADLKEHPQFAAWRQAFASAGWSASRYPASVEALHKRIQRGDSPPRINPPVDLANAAVLSYAVPVGTHDIKTFDGRPLEVRLATIDDQFTNMSGEQDPPESGEIVYAVGNEVRTRRWVWRQGRAGLVAGNASDVFYPVDGFASTYDAVLGATNFLEAVCKQVLGASIVSGLVDRDNPVFHTDSR